MTTKPGPHDSASRDAPPRSVRLLHLVFPAGHLIISLVFIACAFAMIAFSGVQLWEALRDSTLPAPARLKVVLESMAVLTIALAAFELGETIIEEQVEREAQKSTPTRVRRFLSRFMVVLVVALSIESLVLVIEFGHEAPERLPYAASVALAAAALIAAWGLFVRLNRAAEELEPEAMSEAKAEDSKVRG
jgi:hypothetical protein